MGRKLIDQVDDAFNYFNGFRLEELKTLIRKVLEEEYSQDTDINNKETVAKKDV